MQLSALFSVTVAALALAACSGDVSPPEPPRPVASIVVASGSIAGEESFSGEVRARYETPLGFRVGGKLLRRLVDAGATVIADQPLATLDTADAALQLAQAEAERSRALADLQRHRDLRARNFIGQSTLDASETAFKAADAAAGLAHNATQYATLRADAAGVIAATLAEPGQVVTAGEPVVMLAQDGEREVAFSLPESRVSDYAVGDAAEVRLWANESRAYRGRIREIAPAADPATRTYAARLALEDADAAVALGMSARVIFDTERADSVLVPASAIYQQGERPAVWVIDARNVTSLRPVTVSGWRDEGALVTEGLRAGERIVASGVHKVQAGETVRYKTVAR